MADDQGEPTLPAFPVDAQTLPIAKRKRSVASQLFSDSSELAVFSSDDDPAVENYTQGRRKKQYIGTWDRQRPVDHSDPPAPAEKRRRKLQRQLDSGVFMGSDASSIDDILGDFPPPAGPFTLSQASQLPRPLQASVVSPAEAEARRIIQQCIDHGDEYIDLSGLGLHEISNATISVLSEFERIPVVSRGVPFSRQDPEPKLFLSNNNLTRVPGAVFDLDHLTVLSLRGNQLTELPPSIFKLKNLTELKVSQNSLKHLPFELIELIYDERCRLENLGLHPNPFYQPGAADPNPPWDADSAQAPPIRDRGNRWLSKPESASGFYAKFWARTPVLFTDTQGRLYSDFRINQDTTRLEVEHIDSEPSFPSRQATSSTGVKPTKVFSLMELVLQTCARNIPPTDWSDYLDPERYPGLIDLLEDMTSQCDMGGRQCTVCRRSVLRPTAQWIEWWEIWFNCTSAQSGQRTGPGVTHPHTQLQSQQARHLPPLQPLGGQLSQNPDERLVPFLRQACSWACVKDPVRGLGQAQERSAKGPAVEGDTSR